MPRSLRDVSRVLNGVPLGSSGNVLPIFAHSGREGICHFPPATPVSLPKVDGLSRASPVKRSGRVWPPGRPSRLRWVLGSPQVPHER
jgi:hypothetical protein